MLCYCRKEELNELLILSGNLRGTTKLKLYAVMRGTIQIELKFGLMAGISIRRGICIDFRFADLDSCVLKIMIAQKCSRILQIKTFITVCLESMWIDHMKFDIQITMEQFL